MQIQALHVFAPKIIPQEFFPACIGCVPGGSGHVSRKEASPEKCCSSPSFQTKKGFCGEKKPKIASGNPVLARYKARIPEFP